MAFEVLPSSLAVLDSDELVLGGYGVGAVVAGREVALGASLAASWSVDSFATHAYALSVVVTCGGSS